MRNKEARGLTQIAGWIFVIIGILIVIQGFLDIFILSPDSEFVSLVNWRRYALFKVIYGLACLTTGMVIFKFVKSYLMDNKDRFDAKLK